MADIGVAIDKLTEALTYAKPVVVNAAHSAGFWIALRDIVQALVWAGFSALGIVAPLWCMYYLWHKEWPDDGNEIGYALALGGLGLVAFVFTMIFLFNVTTFLDPVVWAGLFNPEVYLAVKVLKL